MSELQFFRRFTDSHEIDKVSNLLSQVNIEHKVSAPSKPSNERVGPSSHRYYELYLKDTDFDRVQAILNERAEKIAQDIANDHYLFTFSDAELFAILAKPQEWSELDVKLCRRILEERKLDPSIRIPEEKADTGKSELDKRPKEIKYILIAILLLLTAAIYFFYNPSTFQRHELSAVVGTAAQIPEYYTPDEGSSYLEIRIIGYKNSFRLYDCAFTTLAEGRLFNLLIDDKVKLLVPREKLNQKNSGSIKVIAVEINGTDYLTLDEFNDCKKSSWKSIIVLVPLLLILLVFRLIKKG